MIQFDESAAIDWIQKKLDETGATQEELGRAWGKGGDDPGNYVSKTLSRKRALKLDEFLRSKDFFKEPVVALPIPIVGKVGAGAHVYGLDAGPIGEIENDFGYPAGTTAAEVEGDSMGALIPDGSVLFYNDRFDAPQPEHINQICIVWCADGRTMVKKLLRGSRYDRWSLMSLNGGSVEDDVFVDHVARVTGVKFR